MKKAVSSLLAFSTLAGLMIAAAPATAQNIDTTGGTSAGSAQPFGVPDTSAYGETFTAPGGALNSFTLYLTAGAGAPISFRGYVYAWNGTNAVGSALYTSGLQTYTTGTNAPFVFNTGSVSLVTGNAYVAFLSTAGLQAGQTAATAQMPIVNDNYAGGTFVYNNAGNNFGLLTTTAWSSFTSDAFFKASFGAAAVVPEPATWAMMVLGFGTVGYGMRRRRTVVGAAHAA